MHPCTRLIALLAAMMLVAGCSSNGDDATAGAVSTTGASSTTTAATTTTSATMPTAPTTRTTAASTTTTQAGDADVWDLVFAQYEADLGAIFDEIFVIRGGEPVILRTADWYIPWGPLETWRECGHEDLCTQCVSNWSQAIHRVADQHGVPVAGLMAACSGPELDQEMPQDYIKDDVHPSDEGAAAIGDVLADLGYEPFSPTDGSSTG